MSKQRCCLGRLTSSVFDANNYLFWRALIAEALGTCILVIIGCGSCIGKDWASFTPTILQISFTFGLAVATIVWCIADVSGGHINPAVTIGMLVSRKISLLNAFLYIVAQMAGAVLGAIALNAITPDVVRGSLGMTTIQSAISVWQGFGVEVVITFVLVLTVFACCDPNRTDTTGSHALTIGLSVCLCHLFAIKYTGSSMNPARSFGPAVVMSMWENHWLYWFGPIAGGVCAALTYDLLFAANVSSKKAKQFFLVDNYDEKLLTEEDVEHPTSEHAHLEMV